jgi:hypothetical protein
LARSAGEVRAVTDLRPYADERHDWWVFSDLATALDGARQRMRADHVLGVSPASTTLAQLTVRRPFGSALDLGTGCGVQSLHLSQHCDRVVATDVSPRCLAMADLTTRINSVTVDLRRGDLFEPVVDERFDLIVSNPPFVVSPGTDERLVYRDSGLPGDELVERLIRAGARRLTDGGWCQLLANWVHRDGDWQGRIEGWVAETGADAWVVQREVLDVSQYVELWLADAGLVGTPEYLGRYDAWLDWFAQQRIEAVGLGWVTLRNAGRDVPVVRIEDWPGPVEQPLGPHISAWGSRVDLLATLDDDAMLAAHLVRHPDVVEERRGVPGDEHPGEIVLRTQRGMRRARTVSTEVAAFVGACDGELTVGQIADAVAALTGADQSSVRRQLLDVARPLVLEEYLALEPAR